MFPLAERPILGGWTLLRKNKIIMFKVYSRPVITMQAVPGHCFQSHPGQNQAGHT
jgi:hypothetical protein